MEISGKITAVLPIASGMSKSGQPWQVQSFVVEETEGQYPQSLCLDIFGTEKIQEANIKVGEIVNVQFNVGCRQFGAKYFNSIKAWRITRQGGNSNYNNNNNNKQETTSAPSADQLPF